MVFHLEKFSHYSYFTWNFPSVVPIIAISHHLISYDNPFSSIFLSVGYL